jgi:hypothetical protein
MVSVNRQALYGKVYNDVRCLSTDTKPTEAIKNGSVLTEIDTGRTYLFDAAGGQWHEIATGGGGSPSLVPMSAADVHDITGLGD